MASKSGQQTKKTADDKRSGHPKSREDIKHPYTLSDCMKMGRTGNILFVVFIVICLIYYYSFAQKGKFLIPFEVVAYGVELMGFAFFSIGVIWLDKLVRARAVMKVLLLVYITVEVILMLLEFQFIFPESYNGLSLPLTIIHSIFSAGVAFSLLSLDPSNKKMEIFVIITCSLMLAGMLFGLAGYRVYASILVNAFAYIFFFSAMLHQLRLDELDIDCYGDKARVSTFDSTMFADSPLMVEKPKKEKESLKKKFSRLRDHMTSDERIILTDRDEKFEYEFGVDDNDDDEYEDGDEA